MTCIAIGFPQLTTGSTRRIASDAPLAPSPGDIIAVNSTGYRLHTVRISETEALIVGRFPSPGHRSEIGQFLAAGGTVISPLADPARSISVALFRDELAPQTLWTDPAYRISTEGDLAEFTLYPFDWLAAEH